jgi:gliding motility-associated-like protein/uncharacterized repeat protein (TIGR01451 family)
VINTATATADTPIVDSNGDIVELEKSDQIPQAIDPIPSIAVTKVVTTPNDGGDGLDVGETVLYTITITNDGNTTLTGVSDPADTDIVKDINGVAFEQPYTNVVTYKGSSLDGSDPPAASFSKVLEADEVVTFEALLTINQAMVDAGGVVNTVSVEGYNVDEQLTADASSDAIQIDANPSLTVTKEADVVHVGSDDASAPVTRAEDRIKYTISIENTGNVTLDSLIVKDLLTDGLGNALSLSESPGDTATPNEWVIDSLLPGLPGSSNALTYTVFYNIEDAAALTGSIINQVDITATAPDGSDVKALSDDPDTSEQGDATVTPTDLRASFEVFKSDDPKFGDDGASVGDLIQYEVEVKNTGELMLTDIELVDILKSGDNSSLYLYAPSHDAGNTTPWETFDLGVGESRKLYGFYVIDEDALNSGSVINKINASATKPDGEKIYTQSDDPKTAEDLDSTVTVFTQAASILINKETNSDDGDYEIGDIIDYTITIRNTGNTVLNGVSMTEDLQTIDGQPLSIVVEFDESNKGVDSEYETSQTLKIDEQVTLTASYTVDQTAIDAGGIKNMVRVSGSPNDGLNNIISDSLNVPLETLINAYPELTVEKTDSVQTNTEGIVGAGATINYYIKVTNSGNVSLTDISINDFLVDEQGTALTLSSPAPAVWDSIPLLKPDEHYTFNASYTLTEEDRYRSKIINTASATANDPSDEQVYAETTVASEVDVDSDPSFAVTKSAKLIEDGNDATQLGDVIQYTIEIENTGNRVLTIDSIADQLSKLGGGALTLSADPSFVRSSKNSAEGTLKTQETATYIATYIISQEAIDAGGVSNVATVTVSDENGPLTPVVSDDPDTSTPDDPTVTLLTRTPEIEVTKTAEVTDEGNGVNGPDDLITYTIQVANTGNVTLTNVLVSDILNAVTDGVSTQRILTTPVTYQESSKGSSDGTLKVGEVATYMATYEIADADFTIDKLSNVATATATAPDTTSVGDANDPTETLIEALASFTVAKLIGEVIDNGDLLDGAEDTVKYIITVTNTGNTVLDKIQVVDTITDADGNPTDLTSDVQYDTSGSGVEGTLQVGETATYTVDYEITETASASGHVINTATVTAYDPVGNDETISAEVKLATGADPSLKVLKTWSNKDDFAGGIVDVGDTVVFTIEVSNTGNIGLTNITYQDILRDGNDVTIANPTLTFVGTDANPQSFVGELAVGETATYTYQYVIEIDDFATGLISNQVSFFALAQGKTVTDISDDPTDPTSDENDPTIIPMGSDPSLEATKTVRVLENGDGLLGEGDTVEYTIVVKNTGNTILSSVTVDDNDKFIDDNGTDLDLDDGPTFTISSEGSDDGTLIPGEEAFYTARFNLTQDVVDSGGLSNQATITANSPGVSDPLEVLSDDPETELTGDATALLIDHNPVIEVVKTTSSTPIGVGDTITYAIRIENKGNVTLDNVTLDDIIKNGYGTQTSLNADIEFDANSGVEGTVEVGQTIIYNVDYTIDQDDFDSGRLENTVLVTAYTPKDVEISDRSDDNDDTDGDTEDDPTVTVFTQSPEISILKEETFIAQAVANTTGLGDTITYTITIENIGDVTLKNIEVTDILTDGLDNTLTLNTGPPFVLDSLDPGVSHPFTATYKIEQQAVNSGSVSNNATVVATSPIGVQVPAAIANPVVTTIDQTTGGAFVEKSVLRIVDNGDEVNGVGDIVQYLVTVENTGNVTLTGVTVTDTLKDKKDNSIDLSSGDLTYAGADMGSVKGTLEPGETATYNGYHIIDQDIVDAGGLSNVATADANNLSAPVDSDDPSTTTVIGDPTETLITATPNMVVEKSAELVNNNDGVIEAGDLIKYTIVATNTGNVTLFDVEIIDSLRNGSGNVLDIDTSAWVKRDISPGKEEIYTAYYQIDQDAADSGKVINTAFAKATKPDGTEFVSLDDSVTVSMTATPSISILKTKVENDGTNDKMDVGEAIDYTITITNTGNVTLDNITLTETLTDGKGNETDLLSAMTLASINDTTTTQTSITSLEVGDKATYTISYTVTQTAMNSGKVTNVATVTATTPDGTTLPTETSAEIESLMGQAPAMTVTKTASPTTDNFILGDTITYTIVVENTGNVEFTDVVVTDNSLVDGAGESLSLTDGPTYDGTGTFDGILSVGETVDFTATFTVNQQSINTGGVSNTASATAIAPDGESITEDSNTATSTITATASLVVNKSEVDPTVPKGLNDLIEYTITVENTGEIILENVTIQDDIEDKNGVGLSLISDPIFAGASENSPEGTLKVSEVATYKAYYMIDQQSVDAGGVVNKVKAEADTPVSSITVTPADNYGDPTVTNITEVPDLEVIKTAQVDDGGDDSIDVDDIINYTIRVTNTGNVTLDNLVVLDSITDINGIALAASPLTTTRISSSQNSSLGSLAVGETATYETSYVVTQEAIDAGGVMNRAIASAESPADTAFSQRSDDGDTGPNDTGEDPTITTIEADPQIRVEKEVDKVTDNGDGYNGAGDIVEYKITVYNEGNVTLTLSSLVDTVSDGNGLDVSNPSTNPLFNSGVELAPGDYEIYTVTYTIQSAVADTGEVNNRVDVKATSPAGPEFEASDSADPVPTGADASLNVTKTWELLDDQNNDGIVDKDDKIKFNISVTNTGNVTLTGIDYEDTFQNGVSILLDFDSGTRDLTFINTNFANGVVGTLQPGETAIYEAIYTVTEDVYQTGEVINTVTFSGKIDGTTIKVNDVSDNGIDTDGNTINDVTRVPLGSAPSAKVVKTLNELSDTNNDGVIGAGDTITYNISVTNNGNVTLTWIDGKIVDTISDKSDIPITHDPPVWQSNDRQSPKGEIAQGETALFTLTYELTQTDVDGGVLYNRVYASLSAGGFEQDYYFDYDEDENNDADDDGIKYNDALELNIEAKPDIKITKTASPLSGAFEVGDNVTYTVEIENTGNVTLDNIVFTDTLTDGDGKTTDLSADLQLTHVNASPQTSLTSLEVGDTATYQVIYTVDQGSIDSGYVENMVSVTADMPSDTAIPAESIDSPVRTTFTQNPAISLEKTARPNPGADGNLDAGDTITYDLALTNDGNVTLQSIELTDILSHTSGGRTEILTPIFVDASNNSTPGILLPGETANYTVQYTVTQDAINAGGVSNQATADAITPSGITISAISDDPTTTDSEDPTITTISGVLDLEVIKMATIQDNGDGGDGVGDVVQYTITVKNTGNLTLDVTLADELKDLKGNPTPLTSGIASLSTVRSIDPGSIETYIVYKLIDQEIVDAGGLTNTATATGVVPDGRSVIDVSDVGDIGVGDTDDDPTVTPIATNPRLEVIKTATIIGDDDGFVGATDVIEYTIRVTNTGNVTVKGVGLVDTLTDGNGDILNIDTSAWLVRDIAPGQTEIYTANYVIGQTAADSGSVSNTVTATGTAPDGSNVIDISDDGDTGTTDTGNDPTVVEMDQIPSIEVIKTAVVIDNNGDGKNGIGDTIEYTITVENTGNTDLTGLSLVDTLTDLNGELLALDALPVFVISNLAGHSLTSLRIGEKFTYTANFTINQQAVNARGVSNTITFTASSPGKSNNVFDVSDDNLPSDGNLDGDSTNDPTVTLTDPSPAMEVIKTAFVNDNGDGLNGAGDIVRYSIEVTNTGDITLDNVDIQTETLTDGNGTLLSLSSGPDYWQPQTVKVGETVVFTALYVISQEAASSGFISNTATAVGSIPGNFNGIEDVSDNGTPTDDDGDLDPDNDPTVVLMDAPPVSSIEVTKEYSVVDNDSDSTNSLGDDINYVITVVNTGNTDLRDVILDDVISDLNGDPLTLSSQPIFVRASLGSNKGILRQGETATYNASFIITQQAIDAGGVSNTVTVVASSPGKTNDIFDISDDGDDTDGNTQNDPTITRTTTTTPPSSSITLTKADNIADTNGDGSIGIGDTITYTLVATNTGNDALSSVTITDILSDLAGNALTLTMQPTFISSSSGSPQGSLQIGEKATYRATFIVNNQAMNAGGVSNTATVTAQGTSNVVTGNSDDPSTSTLNDATVTILSTTPPSSSITLTKADNIADTNGDGSIGIGDTITYTLVATNTGNDALSSVTITDVLSDLAGNALTLTMQPTFISSSSGSPQGSLQIGEQATYRATFIVNNQAMNAGGVSNRAMVTAQGTIGTISDNSDDPSTGTLNDPTITRLTTVTPQSSIEVTKTATITDNGNGTTGLGDTITFLITVENTGSTLLNGVVVNDTFSDLSGNALTLTSGPLFVSANLGSGDGTLLAGETATYTATFVVNAQADNAGGVSNTASATAINPSGTPVNDISDDGDDTDGNTTNDPTVLAFFQDPVDGDFEVFNGMSPGDDGINDYFKIAGIEKYPNNTVKIFNRWGVLVYEAKGYGLGDRLFMGISEGRVTITKDQKLPAGTYFYVVEFEGENPGRDRYTGYLYINRD